MNIRVHVSFWTSVFIFLDIYPRVQLLGHMVTLFSVFWESSILFPTVATSIYIPTNSVLGFSFLQILTNICSLCSFWWYFSDMWGDISLWFWLAFPWWLAKLSIFSCTCWPFVYLLWKNGCSGPLPVVKSDYLFFAIELHYFVTYFGY